MIYVVSGYRRTGTSAMMRALASSMDQDDKQLRYYTRYEASNLGAPADSDGYRPNPFGLFEIGQGQYMRPSYLREHLPDKSLVKIFFDGLPLLPKNDYTIFFMQRDPDEIALSLERVQQYWDSIDIEKDPARCYEFPFNVFREYSQDDIDHVLGICEQRRDMELHIIQFEHLTNDPLAVFETLAEAGVPLHPRAAAHTINPRLRRSRVLHG